MRYSFVISLIQAWSRCDLLTQLWCICFKLDFLGKFALCGCQQIREYVVPLYESVMFMFLVFLSFSLFSSGVLYEKCVRDFAFTLFTLSPLIWLGTALASFGLKTYNVHYLTIVCGASVCNNHCSLAEMLGCFIVFLQALLMSPV